MRRAGELVFRIGQGLPTKENPRKILRVFEYKGRKYALCDSIDDPIPLDELEGADTYQSVFKKNSDQSIDSTQPDNAPRTSGILGIDLGGAFSRVAIVTEGELTVLENAHGNRATPSMVAFTEEGKPLIGEAAQKQTTLNPTNTIPLPLRWLGRKFPKLPDEARLLPYQTSLDKAGRMNIEWFRHVLVN